MTRDKAGFVQGWLFVMLNVMWTFANCPTAGRILSTPAGLRNLKAKTQTGTQKPAHGLPRPADAGPATAPGHEGDRFRKLASSAQGPGPRRNRGRILSTAARLRLLKAKMQARMKTGGGRLPRKRMRVRPSAVSVRRALQETCVKRSRDRSPANGARILSPAAGLRLLKTKTPTRTRRGGERLPRPADGGPAQRRGSKSSASGNLPQALQRQDPRERCPH